MTEPIPLRRREFEKGAPVRRSRKIYRNGLLRSSSGQAIRVPFFR
jgi:hypothetical protein